jgi:hypothetical protein
MFGLVAFVSNVVVVADIFVALGIVMMGYFVDKKEDI